MDMVIKAVNATEAAAAVAAAARVTADILEVVIKVAGAHETMGNIRLPIPTRTLLARLVRLARLALVPVRVVPRPRPPQVPRVPAIATTIKAVAIATVPIRTRLRLVTLVDRVLRQARAAPRNHAAS